MDKPTAILPAVAAIIFNTNGEVLLQKRRDVNQWCILSGHVEYGEDVSTAILREIREETGVKGNIIRFIGVYSSPASQTYHYKNKSVQYITAYFEVTLDDDIPQGFSNEETAELHFFPTSQLPENFAQINRHWLSDALDKTPTSFVR